MQHIAQVIDRSITSLAHANGHERPTLVRTAPTLHTLIGSLEARERMENEDVVLPMSELRLDDDLVVVPNLGRFRLNEWSCGQVASFLGMRWERWFENTTAGQRADEFKARVARASGEIKLRTTHEIGPDLPGTGALTAFVSSGYSPVADSFVAARLATALTSIDNELAIVRFNATDRTVSYVVKVGQPLKVGGPGEVGDVWGGIMVRNSGVGFASLVVTMFLVRLVCRNGMTAPVADAVLLRRTHRGLSAAKIDKILVDRFRELPGRLAEAADRLAASRDRRVPDVSIAVRRLLERRRLPVKLMVPILAAYDREPHASAFGISQAITLAAQDVSPEVRLDLERAAGEYLVDAA